MHSAVLGETMEKKNDTSAKLLLLLSHFSRVRPCATPQTAVHQASPSLGFSRQEHWSGLPFPSLILESEKWKGSRSVVSNSSHPHGLQPIRLLCPRDFPGKSTGLGCHCLLQWKTREIQMKSGVLTVMCYIDKYSQKYKMLTRRERGKRHTGTLCTICATERLTGRKARGLQMEKRGCRCQTFFSLLSGRKKQPAICFLLCTNLKGGFS